jgi:hypothetical protein
VSAFARSIWRDDRRLQGTLLAVMVLMCGVLLGISWRLAIVDPVRLTFNSMLDHMLHGRFDVDPSVVHTEGFLRNGRVYSYFGVWCALLRLPLWIAGRMNLDITYWSILAAVCFAGMAKVRAVLAVRKRASKSSSASWAIGLMLGYIVLAGSATAYLDDSVWNEVMLWGYAFAAVFVYFAVKGIVNRSFDAGTLSWMALCAGVALLTRVTAGIGLMLASGLLLLALALKPNSDEGQANSPLIHRLRRGVTHRRTFIPMGILVAFIAAAGTVNYFRWGNPTTFANYDLYLGRNGWPSFVSSLHTYGAFNLRRIPFGLGYYFLPVWVLHGPGGKLLFENTQTRLFGDIELPPSTFLLTDLLPLCFVVLLAIGLWRRRAKRLPAAAQWATAVSLGLLTPCILMWTLAWMIYRYRLEFYPELEFLAFLGLFLTVTDPAMLVKFTRCRRWLAAALLVSVFASTMAFVLSNLSGDEAPQLSLQHGVVNYYKDQAAFHLHRIIVRDFSPPR